MERHPLQEGARHARAREPKELRHVRKVLRQSLEQCREHEQTGRCEVVDELSARAKRP